MLMGGVRHRARDTGIGGNLDGVVKANGVGEKTVHRVVQNNRRAAPSFLHRDLEQPAAPLCAPSTDHVNIDCAVL